VSRHAGNTNWRMFGGWLGVGDIGVRLGSNRCGAVAVLAIAVALAGCANVDFDANQAFSKPVDIFGTKSGGYTYSDLQETKRTRAIGANELVDASGHCPPLAAPPSPSPAPDNQAAAPAGSADPASLLGGGVALGMSECEVVYRAGQPTAVQLGQNPNGDRTALLTYNSGPRPGIYHFERGALMQMDRAAEPPPAPQAAKKKPAKSAKSTKPPKKSDQT
jgi:hypothetical protein